MYTGENDGASCDSGVRPQPARAAAAASDADNDGYESCSSCLASDKRSSSSGYRDCDAARKLDMPVKLFLFPQPYCH